MKERSKADTVDLELFDSFHVFRFLLTPLQYVEAVTLGQDRVAKQMAAESKNAGKGAAVEGPVGEKRKADEQKPAEPTPLADASKETRYKMQRIGQDGSSSSPVLADGEEDLQTPSKKEIGDKVGDKAVSGGGDKANATPAKLDRTLKRTRSGGGGASASSKP